MLLCARITVGPLKEESGPPKIIIICQWRRHRFQFGILFLSPSAHPTVSLPPPPPPPFFGAKTQRNDWKKKKKKSVGRENGGNGKTWVFSPRCNTVSGGGHFFLLLFGAVCHLHFFSPSEGWLDGWDPAVFSPLLPRGGK